MKIKYMCNSTVYKRFGNSQFILYSIYYIYYIISDIKIPHQNSNQSLLYARAV